MIGVTTITCCTHMLTCAHTHAWTHTWTTQKCSVSFCRQRGNVIQSFLYELIGFFMWRMSKKTETCATVCVRVYLKTGKFCFKVHVFTCVCVVWMCVFTWVCVGVFLSPCLSVCVLVQFAGEQLGPCFWAADGKCICESLCKTILLTITMLLCLVCLIRVLSDWPFLL